MTYLAAIVGAALAALAFPPYGLWPLAVLGPAIWLWGLGRVKRPLGGFGVGFVFGLTFFGSLIWWLSELGWEAMVPLVVVQALYPAVFGWMLVRLGRGVGPMFRWLLVAGLWAAVEFIRYRAPVGGFEWGAWGYALSDFGPVRKSARLIGTSGWTVLIMALAGGLSVLRRRDGEWLAVGLPAAVASLVLATGMAFGDLPDGSPVDVAIVQGSTPCPFVHCENERYRTFQQHLELTGDVRPGSADLVVWSEGSTGSFNADPVNNPEVGVAIGREAQRIGAWMLVGSDRPINETHWVNANVVFSPLGDIVGEYRKRHPVPFGEYIPNRPWFDWIPALSQVPRDMIPGDAPVVFDPPAFALGSVISFEGGFARYSRDTANAGAGLIVVATNEGSYGHTPASDQFIGMTRMRSAETGLDVVHAAVTGKSVLITDGGRLGEATGLGTIELLEGEVIARPGLRTLYVRWGDWMMLLALVGAVSVLLASWPPNPRRST